MITNCDFCAYNEYDEEDDEYYCSVNMDEDDMARFIQSSYKSCPYFKSGDEYKVVRHQMQQLLKINKLRGRRVDFAVSNLYNRVLYDQKMEEI